MLSEWSGYIISITLWSIAAGLFFSSYGWVDIITKIACSLYLFVLSIKLWFSGHIENAKKVIINSKTIFYTTFLNPKSFIFATIIFPVKITDDLFLYSEILIRFTMVLFTASAFGCVQGIL